MRTAVLSCLLFCGAANAGEGVTVGDVMELLTKDWEDDRWILSLRPDVKEPMRGKAWLIEKYPQNPKHGTTAHAYKGKYQLAAPDDDRLLLHVGLYRCYYRTWKDRKGGWEINTLYDEDKTRTGFDVEIPLADGKVPDDGIELVVERIFFVDKGGNETVFKRSNGLFKPDYVYKVRWSDHWSDGRSYTMEPVESEPMIAKYPPPTFKPRWKYERTLSSDL